MRTLGQAAGDIPNGKVGYLYDVVSLLDSSYLPFHAFLASSALEALGNFFSIF